MRLCYEGKEGVREDGRERERAGEMEEGGNEKGKQIKGKVREKRKCYFFITFI